MVQVNTTYYGRNKISTQILFILATIFQILFSLSIPLLNYLLHAIMKLKGISYLTLQNIASFISFLPTMLLFLFMLVMIFFSLFFKITTIIHYSFYMNTDKRPNLLTILSDGFLKTLSSLKKGYISLPLYTCLLYLLTNIPLFIHLTFYTQIRNSSGSSDSLFIKAIILTAILLLGFITFPGIFTIHFHLYQNEPFPNCFLCSKKLIQANKYYILKDFIKINTIFSIAALLSYYFILFLFALLLYGLMDKAMVVTAFLSYYPKINFYYILLISQILFVMNINRITTQFNHFKQSSYQDCYHQKENSLISISFTNYHFLRFGFLILIACGIFNLIMLTSNNTFDLEGSLTTRVQITAHRGNSHVAPENTLPAIENAILARANYVELDIQQSKDGVLMVFHDKKLWRITGTNRPLINLTYQELDALDAGAYFSSDFINTKIPSLEEVLLLCKGKIKLNLEVKSYYPDSNLEATLIQLLLDHDMQNQCFISSSNLETLKKVKELAPEIKTGYIITAAFGNLGPECNHIDFYSIRSKFITKNTVLQAHRMGKEVHAWSIYTPAEVEQMISYGVDNIITSNPTMAIHTLNQDPTSSTFTQLLYRMLKTPYGYPLP